MSELHSPFVNSEQVNVSDSVYPNQSYTGIIVRAPGNLNVLTKGGQTVTFPNIPVNFLLRFGIARVNSTATTATNMIGLW